MKITIRRHEWHQVDCQSNLTFGIEELQQLYPTASLEDLLNLLENIANGDIDLLDEVLADDWGHGYFEFQDEYNDWWTQRKGGYDVTFEILNVENDDE